MENIFSVTIYKKVSSTELGPNVWKNSGKLLA